MTLETAEQAPQDDAAALADSLERLHVASAAQPDSPCARVAASSAQESGASLTFALPTELVIRVLEVAVAALDRPQERAMLLAAPAKVSRAWRYAAQTAFWRHVMLDGVRPSKWDQRFLDAVMCEPSLLRKTQRILFGCGLRTDTNPVESSADPKTLTNFLEDHAGETTAFQDADAAFRQLLRAWSLLTASTYERRMLFRSLGELTHDAATKNYSLKAIEVNLASMHSSNLVHFLQGLHAFAGVQSLTINLSPSKYYWIDEDAPISEAIDLRLAVSRLNLVILPSAVRRGDFTSEPIEFALLQGLRLDTIRSLRLGCLSLKILDSLPEFVSLCSLVIPSERTAAFSGVVQSLVKTLPSLRMLKQLLLLPAVRGLSPEDGFAAGLDYRAFLAALPLATTHCSVRDLVFDSLTGGVSLPETFTLKSGHAVVRLFSRDESTSRVFLRIFTRSNRSPEWHELRHRGFPAKGFAPKHARTPQPRRTQALAAGLLMKKPAASISSAPLAFETAPALQAGVEATGDDEHASEGHQDTASRDVSAEHRTDTPVPPVTPTPPLPPAAAPRYDQRKCCILS